MNAHANPSDHRVLRHYRDFAPACPVLTLLTQRPWLVRAVAQNGQVTQTWREDPRRSKAVRDMQGQVPRVKLASTHTHAHMHMHACTHMHTLKQSYF